MQISRAVFSLAVAEFNQWLTYFLLGFLGTDFIPKDSPITIMIPSLAQDEFLYILSYLVLLALFIHIPFSLIIIINYY